jgi:hypothetical protein
MTTIFSSGWENSGGTDPTDGGAWTGTQGACSISSTYKHHGAYALALLGNNEGKAYKTGMSNGPFRRAYFYFDSLPSSGNSIQLMQSYGSDIDESVYIVNNGAAVVWRLHTSSGDHDSSVVVVAKQWYCVGHYIASGGTSVLYVDGVGVASGSEASTGTVTTLYIGAWNKYGYQDVYVDCVVDADAYIGPEVTPKFFLLIGNLAIQLTTG